MNEKEKWLQVLLEIKKNVSTANFLTLFQKTTVEKIEDKTIYITNLQKIHSAMIEKKYKAILDDAIEKIFGEKLKVVYVTIDPQAKKKKTLEDAPLLKEAEKVEPKITIGHLPRVRPDFTFETLAVSQSNQLAFVSAQTVSKNLGQSYNPLFIYGPVGVGKTHLMQAIANAVYVKNPDIKIIYITSEEFTNEVVEAIRFNDTSKMKRKFRSANLLIIDDVQFIAGKDRVQEELFHTFNTLIDNGAQIVLSSDRPPSEIKKLEARLSSRFEGGLTVDVESPDFEMRTAILLKKAEKFGFPISIETAKAIAEKEQDARRLEGALLKVISSASTNNAEITAEFAQKALKNDTTPTHFHPEDVINSTCNYYSIKPTQLKGPKRDAFLVKARQVAMFLLKTELRLPFAEIGNVLGGRDHTTIMHGVEKVENMRKESPSFNEEILGITKSFRG